MAIKLSSKVGTGLDYEVQSMNFNDELIQTRVLYFLRVCTNTCRYQLWSNNVCEGDLSHVTRVGIDLTFLHFFRSLIGRILIVDRKSGEKLVLSHLWSHDSWHEKGLLRILYWIKVYTPSYSMKTPPITRI